jgi:hypothetical protein
MAMATLSDTCSQHQVLDPDHGACQTPGRISKDAIPATIFRTVE